LYWRVKDIIYELAAAITLRLLICPKAGKNKLLENFAASSL
jgi:hypothetical protein